MPRKIVFCMILVLSITQFMTVDTTLAGGSIIDLKVNTSPGNMAKMSGDNIILSYFGDFQQESIPVKPKPSSTPITPPIPTSTPVPPPIPTNTPTTPPIPTNTPTTPPIPTSTPITPTIPIRTPTVTASRVQSSTSTSQALTNTPIQIKTFTPTLLSPTGVDAEVKDFTLTPNTPSPVSALIVTPLKSSPTSSPQVDIPITGNSTSVKPEALPVTSFLGVLILGLIGIGGLIFGNLKFLGSLHSDDVSPGGN